MRRHSNKLFCPSYFVLSVLNHQNFRITQMLFYRVESYIPLVHSALASLTALLWCPQHRQRITATTSAPGGEQSVQSSNHRRRIRLVVWFAFLDRTTKPICPPTKMAFLQKKRICFDPELVALLKKRQTRSC